LPGWVDLFFSVEGRITRRSFWIAAIVLFAAEGLAGAAANALLDTSAVQDPFAEMVAVVFLYPQFAVAAKRSHDRGRSAWLVGIWLAGGVLLGLLPILTGGAVTPGEDRPLAVFVAVPFVLLSLYLLAELGFHEGTPGPNRYGPVAFGDNVSR
jgi:uncharacterized membrane protein YhaH (DUF805 family)